MTKKIKILLMPDHETNWSAHNRCKYLKKYIRDCHIDIMGAFDRDDTYQKISKIAEDYDFIHLHFTGNLDWFYEFYKEYPEKLLITIINERSIYNGFECDIDKANEMIIGCIGTTSVNRKVAWSYKIDWIPNGVDLEIFQKPHFQCVGYVGTSKPNKNFKLVEQVCQDLELNFLPLLHSDKIIPHEEMWKEYRKMDVLVHASISEGCQNPILEALAMNLPVLMTKEGIWHEFEGWVTFIEPTYDSIYSELKKLNTRKLIQNKFTWEAIAYQYLLFYKRCFARQKILLAAKNKELIQQQEDITSVN